MQTSSADILQTASKAALAAGSYLRDQFQQNQQLNAEYRHTVKLQADLDADSIIIEKIRKDFPEHTILSEESGIHHVENSDFKWMLDPLDGTSNYYRHIPHFCTSIACYSQSGHAICGAIYDPIRDELFTAVDNGQLSLNGKQVNYQPAPSSDRMHVVMGYSKKPEFIDQAISRYGDLVRQVSKVRHTGCSALDLAYVAVGRYDACTEDGIYLWDIAAALPMLKAAGLNITVDILDSKKLQIHISAWRENLGDFLSIPGTDKDYSSAVKTLIQQANSEYTPDV